MAWGRAGPDVGGKGEKMRDIFNILSNKDLKNRCNGK